MSLGLMKAILTAEAYWRHVFLCSKGTSDLGHSQGFVSPAVGRRENGVIQTAPSLWGGLDYPDMDFR